MPFISVWVERKGICRNKMQGLSIPGKWEQHGGWSESRKTQFMDLMTSRTAALSWSIRVDWKDIKGSPLAACCSNWQPGIHEKCQKGRPGFKSALKGTGEVQRAISVSYLCLRWEHFWDKHRGEKGGRERTPTESWKEMQRSLWITCHRSDWGGGRKTRRGQNIGC